VELSPGVAEVTDTQSGKALEVRIIRSRSLSPAHLIPITLRSGSVTADTLSVTAQSVREIQNHGA